MRRGEKRRGDEERRGDGEEKGSSRGGMQPCRRGKGLYTPVLLRCEVLQEGHMVQSDKRVCTHQRLSFSAINQHT